MKKIVCIVGPTASGKTTLGIGLAQKFNGEVVSSDSRVVYRGMEIGTAAPGGKWQSAISNQQSAISSISVLVVEGIPHYLVGIIDPDQLFTVVDWRTRATEAIEDILHRKKLPIIVGGTGLYISALVDQYDIPQVQPSEGLRKELERLHSTKGIEYLAGQLALRDPDVSLRIDLKNPRRVIRALEVCLVSGRPFTKQLKRKDPLYETLQIGLRVSMSELEKRIRQRLDEQLRGGLLIEEVEKLLERYGPDIPPLQGLVYQQMCQYLNGEMSLDQAKETIVLRTRQYAKRQITWFKRDKRIQWINESTESFQLIVDFFSVSE